MSSGNEPPGKSTWRAGPAIRACWPSRAAECLRQADLVLYDYLVNPAVLEDARQDAERVAWAITAPAARPARRDQRPDDRGRAAGQDRGPLRRAIPACSAAWPKKSRPREAGVPLEIVPGVTAGLAVAGYAEIPYPRPVGLGRGLVTGDQRRRRCNRRWITRRWPLSRHAVLYMGDQRGQRSGA